MYSVFSDHVWALKSGHLIRTDLKSLMQQVLAGFHIGRGRKSLP